jgi:hypothetical protein
MRFLVQIPMPIKGKYCAAVRNGANNKAPEGVRNITWKTAWKSEPALG